MKFDQSELKILINSIQNRVDQAQKSASGYGVSAWDYERIQNNLDNYMSILKKLKALESISKMQQGVTVDVEIQR